MRTYLRALFAATVAFSLVACEAEAQLLIGSAGSGAVNENGDLEDLLSFTVPNVEVDFGGSSRIMPTASGAARTFDISPPQEDLDAGVIDLTTIDSGVTDVRRLLVLNPVDFASVTVPGFRLDRVNSGDVFVNDNSPSSNVGGNNAFGFFTNTGTPLNDLNGGDNVAAFANNGTLALRPTSNFNLGGPVGADSTFTLSYDIAVDGAEGIDTIDFSAEIALVDQQLISVVPGLSSPLLSTNPTLSGGDVASFSVNTTTGVVTGVGEDLITRVTQVFSVPEDINAQFLSLTILFGESGTPTGGVDRGAIDNIELSADLRPATSLTLGDFNDSGLVNAADYTVYRDSVGASDSAISTLGLTDGIVNASDYGVFATNFGQGSGAGVVSEATAVPEPTAALTLLAGALLLVAKPRRS